MKVQPLVHTKEKLEDLVLSCLTESKKQGATSAEATVNIEHGLSVTARLGEAETLEHHNDRGLGITIYMGQKKGSASTTNFEPSAIKDAVTAACKIASFTEEDECAGLADAELMATNMQDLDLDHPWGVSPEEALEIAIECENTARDVDKISNSEGASLTTSQGTTIYGNSHNFVGSYSSTRHNLSCVVIAEQDGNMQRDYWFATTRDPKNLESAASIGRKAAERTVSRLGARKISTQSTPVIFEANMARSLLSHFVSAVSGGSLYRNASFLIDHLDKQVFSDSITITEDPFIKGGFGSSSFDLEGVATKARTLVDNGVLKGYVLSSYSARKLAMQTTGNAGGVHNLELQAGKKSLDQLLKQMQKGLLITELIGHGVNTVTGDYSRGAVGYWVENGEIQYPVDEITIAGNLKDMYKKIVEVGNDVDRRSNIITPSLLIDEMMVAGS
ncbi:MAG: metalloprotease PmbA [Gammaproteobacteria bacterium]|nr:metalloprotease PmbA [Gammaproteobacteria bacterium]